MRHASGTEVIYRSHATSLSDSKGRTPNSRSGPTTAPTPGSPASHSGALTSALHEATATETEHAVLEPNDEYVQALVDSITHEYATLEHLTEQMVETSTSTSSPGMPLPPAPETQAAHLAPSHAQVATRALTLQTVSLPPDVAVAEHEHAGRSKYSPSEDVGMLTDRTASKGMAYLLCECAAGTRQGGWWVKSVVYAVKCVCRNSMPYLMVISA
jgi:hypothetical protein